MNISSLFNSLIEDTLGRSLGHFAPELALSVTVVVLLLSRLCGCDKKCPPYWTALIGALVAFVFAFAQFVYLKPGGIDSVFSLLHVPINALFGLLNLDPANVEQTTGPFFTGLLIFDQFTVFLKLFLLLFVILVIALTVLTGIPDNEDGPDFYTLLLGATIGMMLMSSANHLLILFLGIEMTSVPSYVMAGFQKGRRKSSEAALKYVIYGAGVAGVMLYGISLLVGLLGTGTLITSMSGSNPAIAEQLTMLLQGQDVGMSNAMVRTVMLASMMVLVGIAFKLSLFPFHFWCPDVFEGASAEVGGFLSVASKAAAFALLVRFCLAFMGDSSVILTDLYVTLGIGLGVIAALSATFGNLAAYGQTNVKRLLAYSTIAHAGYMLMAVSALLITLSEEPEPFFARLDGDGDGVLHRMEVPAQYYGEGAADGGVKPIFDHLDKDEIDIHEFTTAASSGLHPGVHNAEARRCLEGLLYYLAVYLFMNLGAFAIVALIRNQIYSEEIADYAGLIHQTPVLCICMLICMFSLVGIPPMGGFIGKFMIFASLFEAGKAHWSMWLLLVIGGLNTVFSLFYYLRVLKPMFMEARPEGAREVKVAANSVQGLYVVVLTIPILALGTIFIEPLSQTAQNVASVLLR
jgi:NADH-quinone oxidoreductase subunit N